MKTSEKKNLAIVTGDLIKLIEDDDLAACAIVYWRKSDGDGRSHYFSHRPVIKELCNQIMDLYSRITTTHLQPDEEQKQAMMERAGHTLQ